jgi:hypothetical protein
MATKIANNEAANLISLGRYGEAHRLLKSAVQALIPYLPLLNEKAEDFCKVVGSTQQLHCKALQPREGHEERDLYEVATPIFAYPFAASAGNSESDLVRNIQRLCVVAMYNLGVACHLESLATLDCGRTERLQRRSTVFYRHSLQFLAMTPSNEQDSSLMYVYMAICNNCAEIALQNGNLAEHEEWKLQLSMSFGSVSPLIEPNVYAHFQQMRVMYSSASLIAARAA